MTAWDGPTLTLIIAQLFGGLVTVIGAIFAGIAMLRAGRASTSAEKAKAKVEEVGGTVAEVATKTDGTMTRLTEQNKMLADKLEAMVLSQVATLTAAHQAALTKVQTLEAEVVKRADAMPPLQPVVLDAINRRAATDSIQAAMAELNKRLDALGPELPSPGKEPHAV